MYNNIIPVIKTMLLDFPNLVEYATKAIACPIINIAKNSKKEFNFN